MTIVLLHVLFFPLNQNTST